MTCSPGPRPCCHEIYSSTGSRVCRSLVRSTGHYGRDCPQIADLVHECASFIRSSYFDPYVDTLIQGSIGLVEATDPVSPPKCKTPHERGADRQMDLRACIEEAERLTSTTSSSKDLRPTQGVKQTVRKRRVRRQSPKNFSCEKCPKRFSQSSHLRSHFNTVHLHLKEFCCELCSTPFGLRSNLLRHRREKHGTKTRCRKSNAYSPVTVHDPTNDDTPTALCVSSKEGS